jgi:hypothetical protein
MRYMKRILSTIFAITLLLGTVVVTAEAQSRGSGYKRPAVRYYYVHRPFWGFNHWGYWNDPYYYDPYLNEQRTRYYKERDVRDKRKDLAEDREKYQADGYLTEKERQKLAKAERKYREAVEDLRDYNSDE